MQAKVVMQMTQEAGMEYMLCRNRVKDAATWKVIFDAHRATQERAGLHLQHLWASAEDPNNIFARLSGN